MKYSFVIPCYGSEDTISTVIDEINTVVKDLDFSDYEIILINDSSPDDVWSKISSLCNENKNIIGINLSKNYGQHAALLAGYRYVTGDIIISLDDDGQSPIDELDKLLSELENDKDVVYAYYDDIKQKNFRKIGTKFATYMSKVILNAPDDFKGSSFYVAKRFVIDEMVRYDNAYPYLLGLVLRTTRKIGYVSATQRSRKMGKSGYSLKSLFSLWLNGFTAFSVKPLELGTYVGVICATGGFIGALVAIIRKIINPSILLGWSSIISILLIMGGVIMLMLGLIGEYIGRIYICINKAPQYVIREIISGEDENNDKRNI